MNDGKLFKAWINPLQFLEVDEPWTRLQRKPPSAEDILRFVCTPGIDNDIQSLVERYRRISKEKKRLFAAPYEDRILNKLVWPLRHAKACYMVGNYLGTISLSGMAAEMVAILLFDIYEPTIKNKAMTAQDEKALFGSSFEKLGQHRRVEILHAFNIIDGDLKKDFDLIRLTRRKYLHLWSQDHATLPSDAVSAYNAAVSIVVKAIGQDIHNGKISLNPALVKYLERSGVFVPDDEAEE